MTPYQTFRSTWKTCLPKILDEKFARNFFFYLFANLFYKLLVLEKEQTCENDKKEL